MLPITLELPLQNSLTTEQHKSPLPFELKVVQDGLFTELRISFPSEYSAKSVKRRNDITVMKNNLTVKPSSNLRS